MVWAGTGDERHRGRGRVGGEGVGEEEVAQRWVLETAEVTARSRGDYADVCLFEQSWIGVTKEGEGGRTRYGLVGLDC